MYTVYLNIQFCFVYQFITAHRRERLNKKALLVWAPTENILEVKCNKQ